MGFDQGNIVLDSPDGSYFAGQTIFGKLQFHQDKVKTFRGIYVKVKGKAEVRWTTTVTRRRDNRSYTETVVHSAEEEYFNTKVYHVGSDHGEHTLDPGKHEFLFQCHIPASCPTSFDGEYGHIRYTVKVVVDRKFKTDQEKSVSIRVIAQKDLNMIPKCKDPLEFNFEETYCCWCMQSGVCDTVVKLLVSGYVPGQVVPVELSCANKGSVEIDEIKMKIFRRTKFHAEHNPQTKEVDEDICSVKKGPIPGDTSRNWLVDLDIPSVDVLNVDACRFIEVEYFFKVAISVSGCHNDADEKQLIIFGDIPLVGHDYMPEHHQETEQHPNETKASIPLVNTPYPGAHPTIITTQPYPGSNPTVVSPYPNHNPAEGFPGVNTPYPGANSPYPSTNSPYPATNSPLPGTKSPYPGTNSPYPGTNSPLPGTNSPYAGVNSHLPSTNSPYPGVNSPYPSTNSPYPGTNSPLPGTNSPYPGTNSPYPGMNSLNLNTNTTYPGSNPQNPGASPYSATNPPCPGANSPYPGENPVGIQPIPTNSPYPPANPIFAPGMPGYPSPSPAFPGAMPMPELPTTPGFKFVNEKQESEPWMRGPLSPRAPSPYVASAPEASGDSSTTSKPTVPDTPTQHYPYNPDFMSNEEK